MRMNKSDEILTQSQLNYNIERIPVEYIKWGTSPDHFKIDMPHKHEFDELLFFTKGGGTHEIDFVEYNIVGNSVHFIPSKTVHFLKRSPNSDGFTIAFNKHFLQNHPVHPITSPLPVMATVMNMTEGQFQIVIQAINILIQQINKTDTYFVQKCFLTSLELVFNEIMSCVSVAQSVLKSDNSIVMAFQELIEKEVKFNRQVEYFANQLHVSPKYLGNLTKKHVGLSPKEMIAQCFIRHIKVVLANPSYKSIMIVADELNISDSALCTYFKKSVGFTIEEYRSQINQLL